MKIDYFHKKRRLTELDLFDKSCSGISAGFPGELFENVRITKTQPGVSKCLSS